MGLQALLCSRGASSLATTFVCIAYLFGQTSALMCHCLNSTACDPSNGFCPSGCDRGWYGPGCQVGNLALGKAANQSTTDTSGPDNTAARAVDGVVPPIGDATSASCSSTQPFQSQNAWWYVTLSDSQVFVITNITIVNRQGITDTRLNYFYILYTNDTAGPPNPATWSQYGYDEDGPNGKYIKTYTSKGLAIGRQVAVYLTKTYVKDGDEGILQLCEVYVYGYSLTVCLDGFFGPGCLQPKYDSSTCPTSSNPITPSGGCQFSVCPDNAFWPPGCWITTPSFANATWKAEATCDHIRVSAQPLASTGNLPATSILINTNASGSLQIFKQLWTFGQSGNLDVNVSAFANRTYYIWLTPQTCLQTIGCPGGPAEVCSANASCLLGVSSFIKVIQTASRQYKVWDNGSCIFANTTVSSPTCEPLISLSVSCNNNSAVSQMHTANIALLCDLSAGMNYNCTVTAVLSSNTTEEYAAAVYMPLGKSTSASTPVTVVPLSGSASTAPTPDNVAPTTSVNIATTPGNLPQDTSQTGVIAGSVSGVLPLVAIIVTSVVVVFRRKRQILLRKGAADSDYRCVGNSSYEHPVEIDQIYSNVGGMSLSQFQQYVNDESLIKRRFEELNANQNHPCLCGKDPANKGKNRFQNILPYDVNRVLLAKEGDNYINASFINGYLQPKKYIATQGPSAKTVDDFWHMVWQESATTIVMLTDYVEQSKKKCEQYFPKAASEGCHINVSLRSTAAFDTHTISTLNLQNMSENRIVNHYHLTAWRDKSVPDHCAQILLFYCKIPELLEELKQQSNGPIIVHCSAGVGRTGAFLAFDYLQQSFRKEGRIDVDYCVLKLRDQRMFMVQTKEQYVFLHAVALYAMKTMRFVFDAVLLPAYMKKIAFASNSENPLTEEWQLLQEGATPISACQFVTARLEENASKNRDEHILASELKRPILSEQHGTSGGYINAVFCNGCYSDRCFIATQLPPANTVNDFWQMVYECRVSCIVLLHNLPPDEDCPQYWPDPTDAMAAGLFVVTNVSQGKSGGEGDFQVIDLTLSLSTKNPHNKVDPMPVKLYILNAWHWAADVPKDVKKLLSLAMELTSFCKNSHMQPVVVQCRDGASHCGFFVTAINSLHRLVETSQVQVFHSVDLARASRPEFIKSQEQYRFIYEFLSISH